MHVSKSETPLIFCDVWIWFEIPTMQGKYAHTLSIGDWVLCKRGLDRDNFYSKFLFNFRKRKLYIFATF